MHRKNKVATLPVTTQRSLAYTLRTSLAVTPSLLSRAAAYFPWSVESVAGKMRNGNGGSLHTEQCDGKVDPPA